MARAARKVASKVRKVARKRARATKKVARKVRKVARKRARATKKVASKVRKVARKRARATRKVARKVRKVARKVANKVLAQPSRERIAPVVRAAIAMPVAMSTKNPIRPDQLRPRPLFDRDVPAHDED